MTCAEARAIQQKSSVGFSYPPFLKVSGLQVATVPVPSRPASTYLKPFCEQTIGSHAGCKKLVANQISIRKVSTGTGWGFPEAHRNRSPYNFDKHY